MTDFLVVNIAHGLTGDAAGTRIEGAMRVRAGKITEIGPLAPLPGERIVDARGGVVTPGLVNTHHHLFQSILKAVPDGMDAALDPWLMRVPFTWWPHLDETALRVAATVGLAELALSGATTVCDHHYVFSERLDYDPAEILFRVAARFGMRFVLARGGGTRGRVFDDSALPPPPVQPLETLLAQVAATTARFHDPGPGSMTRVALAPTTPTFNVDPGALREIAQAARSMGLRLHSHLSENEGYAAFTLDTYGQRPVDWLAGHDWLGPDVWFAHLVDVTPVEVNLLAETGTAMAHCPQANARLGSGVAPADALHGAGGTVSLAVDGAGANEAADMGNALYAAFGLHRATKGAAAVRPTDILHWATMGGAKALGLPAIGQLAPGMAADFAIFDLDHPAAMGLHDPALAPVICGGGLPVRCSFVAGRAVVEDGRVPWLDMTELAAQAHQATASLIARKEAATAPDRTRAAHA